MSASCCLVHVRLMLLSSCTPHVLCSSSCLKLSWLLSVLQKEEERDINFLQWLKAVICQWILPCTFILRGGKEFSFQSDQMFLLKHVWRVIPNPNPTRNRLMNFSNPILILILPLKKSMVLYEGVCCTSGWNTTGNAGQRSIAQLYKLC